MFDAVQWSVCKDVGGGWWHRHNFSLHLFIFVRGWDEIYDKSFFEKIHTILRFFLVWLTSLVHLIMIIALYV